MADESSLARGRQGRLHKLHRPTLALLPRPPRTWGVWPRTTTRWHCGPGASGGAPGMPVGLLPLPKTGQRPGLGVQDNDPTGRRTLHNVVASAPSHDSCLRAEMTCLSTPLLLREPQHPSFFLPLAPLCPISKTPMFHVPLSRAPSSSRALGGPRPTG